MSICNMAIEAGARGGMVAPDEKTFEYVKGRPMAPRGEEWDRALAYWKTLPSDAGAKYDKEVIVKAADIVPTVTWGTSPEQALPLAANVPSPDDFDDPIKKEAATRAVQYMGLTPGEPISGLKIDRVFIGSCTNSRLADLRAAANEIQGRKVADGVRAMVVPGSGLVRAAAEAEGLDDVFRDAGFEWREPGCSMCLGMNPDTLQPGERCASTSNRNFEGRQGRNGRTHLVSPRIAARAALSGTLGGE